MSHICGFHQVRYVNLVRDMHLINTELHISDKSAKLRFSRAKNCTVNGAYQGFSWSEKLAMQAVTFQEHIVKEMKLMTMKAMEL